jgi:hemerythrin superfamily protein
MFGLNKSDTPDALDLLRTDHKEVDGLFKDFESAREGKNAAMRRGLVTQICDALTVHAKIEEEIFYPALRRASKEAADLLNEAAVEHQSLKDIIGRLQAAPTSDVLYDAGVKVLSEYVKHHVREEENDIFPKARSADIDLAALGAQLQQRKDELMGNMQRPSKRSKGSRSARGGAAESRA